MAFVSFINLTREQRQEAYAIRPKWEMREFQRFQFWIKSDGHLSKRNGHHRLTDAEGKKIDMMLKGLLVGLKTRGDLGAFRTAKFSVDKS